MIPSHEQQPPGQARIDACQKRRRRLCALAAAWTLFVSVGGYIAWFCPPAPAFGIVVPGVLYRSGQPGRDALRVLQQRYGIRTIVNLRSPRKLASDPLARQEAAFARANDINLVILPYGDPSPDTQVEKFLAIVSEPANRPVLVHCSAGEERNGVMVAVYRIREQGWSLPEATAEMESFGFEPEKKPEMMRIVTEEGLRVFNPQGIRRGR